MKYIPFNSKTIFNYKKKYTFFYYFFSVTFGIVNVILILFLSKTSFEDPIEVFFKIVGGLITCIIPLLLLKDPDKVSDSKEIYFKPSRTIRIIEENNTCYRLYYRRFNQWVYEASVAIDDLMMKDEKIAEMKIAYREKYFSKPITEKKKIYWSGRI